ncbi:MAG: hypothetical protein ACI4RA_03640 [Kiritimatiellia bacterium]
MREVFGLAVLWGCAGALTALGAACTAWWLARLPARVRRSARRRGWAAVSVLAALMALAVLAGTPTNEYKRLWREARRQDPAAAGLPFVRPLAAADYAAGLALACVGTGEAWDFSAPAGAEVCADWEAFGAARDWFAARPAGGWSFAFGTNAVAALTIHSDGAARPVAADAATFLAPLRAELGIAPAANWGLLAEVDRPSRFWWCLTPSNTFVATWRNALLGRRADRPVSFQMELWPKGGVVFRYDLSRLGGEVVSGLSVGVSNGGVGRVFTALARDTTSLRWARLDPTRADDPDPDGDGLTTEDEILVHGTDPYSADTDLDGLADGAEIASARTDPLDPHSLDPRLPDWMAVALGGADPLSFPEGSTNAVWEHILYTGTTNGAFAYPQSSAHAAVLSVSATGNGTGDLVVGGRVLPLLPGAPPLRIEVMRNEDVPLVLRGGAALDVAFDSEDFAFGTLPTQMVPSGSVTFPDTKAEAPCIHDLTARRRRVTLPARGDGERMTCSWETEAMDVVVENEPPRAARVTALFPVRETRGVAYAIDHPRYLFGRRVFRQTVRFCPRPQGPDAEDPDPSDPPPAPDPDWPPWLDGAGESPEQNPQEPSCCLWGTCCRDDGVCLCGCDICGRSGEESGDDGAPPPEDVCAEHKVPYAQCAPLHEAAYTNAVRNVAPLADVLYIHEPPVYTPIALPCPKEPHRCCECPEHWTNYVAVAYRSERLKVIDERGNDFSRANEPCTVRVAAVAPSASVGDARLVFATNGAVLRAYGYTALGVGLSKPEGAPLAAYNALSPTLGVPMPVTTNIRQSLRLDLHTRVGLPSGSVRFEIADADGAFTVWLEDARTGGLRRLLDTAGASAVEMPVAAWRRLLGRALGGPAPTVPIYVTSSRRGSARLRIGYWGVVDGRLAEDWQSQTITSIDPPLLPDYDRDGQVDSEDARRWVGEEVFHFWSNDDVWRGDDAFDAYGTGFHPMPYRPPANGADAIVNGRNDLVNLCPLAVDLTTLRRAWGDGAAYEFLTGGPGSVRFTFAETRWDAVGDMVRVDQRTVFDEDLHEARLATTGAGDEGEVGFEIPARLLDVGERGRGIVAVEFADPVWRELRVRVRQRGTGDVLFESSVGVRVCDVHRMYRWLNLEHACGASAAAKYATRTSVDWPDAAHADADVVFVHGYNMHPDEAWDWSQAMFKRLWWSGLDAGFAAVLWRGNEGQFWLPGANAYVTRNYHQNVLNAFRTAGALAKEVGRLPGARKYLVAHSLGNMVVSAARQDHGLRYERYFMLNAAVPVEAYDAGGATEETRWCMTPEAWRGYPECVRASRWHALFPEGDARRALTWKGRFGDVDGTVNLYSSQDEVVANGDGTEQSLLGREYAWYNQEWRKGFSTVDLVPEAGWGFGRNAYVRVLFMYVNGEPVYRYRLKTAAEADGIGDDELRVRPFFGDFTENGVYGDGGSEFLREHDLFRWRVLSHGIPAESFAAGANPVPKWGPSISRPEKKTATTSNSKSARNVDMEHTFKGHRKKWLHSYFISAPLLDTHELFEWIVREAK